MDPTEVLELVTLNAIIDSVLGLVIGLWLVARKAGQWARRDWTAWLESDASLPYLDRVADRVEARMEPRLNAFEERLAAPVQIDLAPIVAMVSGDIVPKVKEEVERIRAVIDGKIGFVRKVAKNTGEAIAEAVGEGAAIEAAGGDPIQAEMVAELDNLLSDQTWVQDHKLAAFGLRILKRSGGAALGSGSSTASGSGGLRRRR